MKNQKSYKNPVDKAPSFQQSKKGATAKLDQAGTALKPADPKQALLDRLQAKSTARKSENAGDAK